MKYVGVTIGPIFNTISEASSPAALWFSSTMFSDITRRICIELNKRKMDSFVLISPKFDPSDEAGILDGVGKYHDRIIFRVEMDDNSLKKELSAVVEEVKNSTCKIFGFELNNLEVAFLKKYLQINYVILNKEILSNSNPILALSPYLDAVECMKTFPSSNAANPIAKLINGKENSKNELIKKSLLYTQMKEESPDKPEECNPFMKFGEKKEGIWSIEDISNGTAYNFYNNNGKEKIVSRKKYAHYYAVVSADADNMGEYLKTLNSDQEIQKFSGRCLEYSKEAAQLVKTFGGMTIYAGGDDLLFLAPVKVNDRSIFDLCNDIKVKFDEIVQSTASLSFGVSIQYEKYPLYQSLEHARHLLGIAKGTEGKNSLVFQLQKHSGQSTGVVVGFEHLDIFKKFLDYLSKDKVEGASVIKGIVSSIYSKYFLIKTIDDNRNINRSWDNLFDNVTQQGMMDFVHDINREYYEFIVDTDSPVRIFALPESFDEDMDDQSLNCLLSILRFSKFLIENEGEVEK